MSPTGSSRWSPTTEQLMILEELYRSGIRTPSASQIQQITTHLSFYGRIEGKNVFYWFQNHKARDRQKLRRKLNKQLQLQQQLQLHNVHHFNQDFSNRFLAGFGYPSCSPVTKQVPFYATSGLSFQGGGVAAYASQEGAMNCKCSVHHNSESLLEKNKEMRFFNNNYGWTLGGDVNHYHESSCCTTTNQPLKTLDLFPVTSTTRIKEDCTKTLDGW
ncbi:hypothetical protein HN51_066245 [Arachis hypogaea]|uniref:WUSCHEL-related homeobox 3 n=1 Tax=Arachis ipaensis TaxID=130454 RepID=UPI0007AF7F7C|nr:WUSCHEL-related homeobox 3 [Arachis ipaensis]XP_025644925.1 WUSCHEL-related homeobox 3-like [Arachis hypogaea]